MIRYRFGRDDLLRTRFAMSPLFEATASVAALRETAAASLHLPWVRAARGRLAGADLSMLEALGSRPGDYTPDFISPPPESPLPDVPAELARVARTPAAQIRREVGHLVRRGRPPAPLAPLLDDPRRGLEELVRQPTVLWERAIAPFWERVLAVLEDDIAHRARLLTAGGAIEVFADLHPHVRWDGDGLAVDRPTQAEVDLAGRGLQLVPSVFAWPRVAALFDPPWQPA